MKTIKSYVPILRWRQAEMLALEKLYPNDRATLTPLIEFIMPPPKIDKNDYKKILEDSKSVFLGRLPEVAQELLKYWGNDKVFIDAHLIDGDIRPKVLEDILSATKILDIFSVPVIHIIPVTSTDADKATRDMAVKFSKLHDTGLCIRIDKSHLDEKDLSQNIKDFVTKNDLKIKDVDIIVDLKIVGLETIPEIIADKLSKIPFINEWRSFIVSGGAFPKDLSELEKHEHHELTRFDWNLWNNLLKSKNIVRKPIFSDYTIQHPVYYGHVPGVNPSASIRYTDYTKWDVMRGEGLRNEKGQGHKQYPAQAKLLVEQPFFRGKDYSFGDNYIAEKAGPKNEKNGNPKTWLTAGINHHLTLVARQVANLA